MRELEAALDAVAAGQAYCLEVRDEAARLVQMVKLIRDGFELGLLAIEEDRVGNLERDMLQVADASLCMKEQIDEAAACVMKAVRAQTELAVSNILESADEIEESSEKMSENIEQATARAEEASHFSKVCQEYMKLSNVPTFGEK